MQYHFRQLTHKIAILLIAVVLLQFAGANLGAHQLHLGNSEEKSENHPHLAFTAEITSLAQCLGCDSDVASNIESFITDANITPSLTKHNHLASKTETKTFDLCLDCQCHGGHVMAMSIIAMVPSIPNSDELTTSMSQYLPPEAIPDYRPPIV